MKVIAYYDVKSDRTQLFKKELQKYLNHVQYSVFEGRVTEAQLMRIRDRMKEMTKPEECVIIWSFGDNILLDREIIGKRQDDIFV